MGTSRSFGELSVKLNRLAAELGDVRKPLEAAALAAKKGYIAASPGVVGHKVPRRSRARGIKVRYDITGNTAIVRFTGPAHLAMNPTRAHKIVPGRTRSGRRRRNGKRALTINGGFAAYANHPGTRGKDPGARRAKSVAIPLATKAWQDAAGEAIRRSFG